MKLQEKLIKLVLPVLFLSSAYYLTFFVKPVNLLIVILNFILISLFFYLITAVFLPKKNAFFIALTVFFLLTVSFLIGFDILNSILIISLMIGVNFLVK